MTPCDSAQIGAKPDASRLAWPAIASLIGLFLVRGFILAAEMPPFEGWDEYQHVGYIDFSARRGEPAVYQKTMLEAGFLAAVSQFPLPNGVPPSKLGALSYFQYWNGRHAQAADTQIGLYEAQQPWLYYRLMAPIYRLCGGRDNLRLAVSVLRLINVAFGAMALGIVLLWIRNHVHGPLSLMMGCWVAFHPLLLLNVMRVANDALAYLLGVAVVAMSLTTGKSRGKLFWVQWALMAPLLALSILAKATNLALVPVVVASLAIRVWRQQIGFFRALAALVLICALVAAITGSYFSFNLRHFGVLIPMQEAVINHQANRRLIDILKQVPVMLWPRTTAALWVYCGLWTGGWSFLRLPLFLPMGYDLLILSSAAAAATGVASRRGRLRVPVEPAHLLIMLLLWLSVESGLMYHAAESYAAWSGVVTTNAWYSALAIPWWLILLSAGVWTLPWRAARILLLASMPILCLIAEMYGLIFMMVACYAAAPFGGEALRRLASLHPAGMGVSAVFIAAAIGAGLLITLIRTSASTLKACAENSA